MKGETTRTTTLETTLAHYEAELKALEASKPTPATVLALLLCRDQVAVALAGESASPQTLQRLVDLDCRVRETAPRVAEVDWDAWRQILNPPLDRWWWQLDKTHAKTQEKRDLLWVPLAGLLMTVTLSLALEIIQRLWGGGPDPLSLVGSILTLALTGSPLTGRGRELAGWLMERVHLPTRYRGETMLGAASLAFIVTLFLRLALPGVAVASNNRGYALLQVGDLEAAQRAFQRAVAINPEYAAGYYNLADAYVGVGDYDEARSLYDKALVADRTLDLAYNGLGYVLILQGEPEEAMTILYAGLGQAQDDIARAALWTNLGRAYLEAEMYYRAETALAQALSLDSEEATALCTLALTAEALQSPEDEVKLHWENCLRYVDPTKPREQELAVMARARLQQLEEEK